MEPIHIPRLLKAPEKTVQIQLQEFIQDLETLTPVRGTLTIRHQRTFLEVQVSAETIVTLSCHRCLQQYNHRLVIETTEVIWLEEISDSLNLLPLEREVQIQDLSESLPPQGYFDLERWLYEQFTLALPLRQLCNPDCPGVAMEQGDDKPTIDSRWAALANLADSPFTSVQQKPEEKYTTDSSQQ